jgi:2'-5' RNA ligase
MPESALLVPVPAADPVVERWRTEHDPAARDGVPAHVTVLYPFMPPDDISEHVIEELRTLFGNIDAFEFALVTADRFPGILYLVPEPAEPFLSLVERVYDRWPEFPPYAGEIDLDRIVPHVTVTDGAPIEAMEKAAADIAEQLPIETQATEVWLMTRFTTRWNTKAKFPLS